MNVALIMAGGSGKRMQLAEKKQFVEIENRPLIAYTIDKFCGIDDIGMIIIVVPNEDIKRMREICAREFSDQQIRIIQGGNTRQQSVLNGLQACPPDTKLVLIHDAVRPFIKPGVIKELLRIAAEKRAVIPVSRVRYTIKQSDGVSVSLTVPRSNLYNAQTPQVFDWKLIKKCHREALNVQESFTDDSSILEYYKIPVYLYLTDDSNFKITERHDLFLARLLISEQAEKS